MKTRSIFIILLSVTLWAGSCKKEVSNPDIHGEWLNTEVYQKNASGKFEWTTVSRFPITNRFFIDGRPQTFSDIEIGSRTFQSQPHNSKLTLHYEAGVSGSTEQKVDQLTTTILETSIYDASGNLALRYRFKKLN